MYYDFLLVNACDQKNLPKLQNDLRNTRQKTPNFPNYVCHNNI